MSSQNLVPLVPLESRLAAQMLWGFGDLQEG